MAEKALASALAQRDAAAEALLSDRQGWVEGQRPEDVVWSDRDTNSILIEEEKVRTLSRSTAQITFRDDSRLRLNPNSQAVIQRMRVDPLSREEEAKVTLVEGDLYALLSGKSERKTFGLEIPDVQTEIDSTSFWVRHDVSGSKFANYDERTLQVAAQGESVTLGKNEGTVVRSGRAPSEKMEVLGSPTLTAPQDDAVAYNADLELQLGAGAGCRRLLGRGRLGPGLRRDVAQPVGAQGHQLPHRGSRRRLLLLAGRGARQVRPAGHQERCLALQCQHRRHAALPCDREPRRTARSCARRRCTWRPRASPARRSRSTASR